MTHPVTFPPGGWIFDARGAGRGVRVSAHTEAGFLVLSTWKSDMCVGTVRLLPDEASQLVSTITDGGWRGSRRQTGRRRRASSVRSRWSRTGALPLWRHASTRCAWARSGRRLSSPEASCVSGRTHPERAGRTAAQGLPAPRARPTGRRRCARSHDPAGTGPPSVPSAQPRTRRRKSRPVRRKPLMSQPSRHIRGLRGCRAARVRCPETSGPALKVRAAAT